MPFKEVAKLPDFPKQERAILEWWYQEGIVNKYLHKNDNSQKRFSFLDGPITANNPMGVHHAHGRTLKDFFQRYKNMQGFRQRFQNGFDSQGLWVEVEVERDLGFNSKREIEEFGLENFSKACRARVQKYSQIQTRQSQRLGMFMDWGNDYYTMSDRNNEHIWYFLKKCHERGLIYQGADVMPWCIRCGTAISQHELSDGGYKTLTHDSVYVKFRLQGQSLKTKALSQRLKSGNVFFLVWTTTPWTLPANTALAVKSDAVYVAVEEAEEVLILAEDLVNVLFSQNPRVIQRFQGRKLVGASYEPLYSLAKDSGKKSYQVVAADFVSMEEGTGIVHIAPGAGKDDYMLSKKENLEVIALLDELGNYLNGLGQFVGKSVREVNQLVVADLMGRSPNLLFKRQPITHSYPVCWRCKEELVFRLTKEWFIAMDPLRKELKKAAKTANWLPEFAGKRMQDWLDSMGDWPISRRRYWGLALPFWECAQCSHWMVIGQRAELRSLAQDPQKVDALPELHRPWIDEIKLRCEKCSGEAVRVQAVGDAWLDAGIVPYSTLDYLTDRSYWKKWFPFELVVEYLSQVRLWFYSTLVMSVVLRARAPWKNVLAGGYVVDEKGEPMHKSTGNMVEFNEAADKVGADVMRWLYLREGKANFHGAGKLRFGYNVLGQVRRRFFLIFWNVYKFFVTYANLDCWKPSKGTGVKVWKLKGLTGKGSVLDRWIMSKLNVLVKEVTSSLDRYDAPTAALAIEEFVVSDLSAWYVRRSRDRVGATVTSSADKESFYQTTYEVLMTLVTLLSPFAPFITEEIYQNLKPEEGVVSVHLRNWSGSEQTLVDRELLAKMGLVREIVEKGHAARKKMSVRVRQPLKKLRVQGAKLKSLDQAEGLLDLIKDELNVKEIELVCSKKGEITVELSAELSSDLIREGQAREIVREVQSLRAKAGFAFDERADLYWRADSDDLKEVIEQFSRYIEQKTLSKLRLIQDHRQLKALALVAEGKIKMGQSQVWLGVKLQN